MAQESVKVQKVLVSQTAYLGDLLLAIPLLKNIRRIWPNVQIDLLCRKGLGDIFLKTKLVDQVFEVDKKSFSSRRRVFGDLKKQSYDLLLAPHPSVRSFLWAMQIHAMKKIGYRTWWSRLFFSYSTIRDFKLPDALRQLSLLRFFDSKIDEEVRLFESRSPRDKSGQLYAVSDFANMQIESVLENRREARNRIAHTYNLDANRPILILAPGSTWSTKQWTKEGFLQAGLYFRKQSYQVIITGTEAERPLCKEIAAGIPEAKVLAGQLSLFEILELFSISTLLICNDSGAMHLASTVNLPTVAVFGPTVLEFGYRPWQEYAEVAEAKLDCRPCAIHGGRYCQIKTHACMKEVSSEDVIGKAKFILKKAEEKNH